MDVLPRQPRCPICRTPVRWTDNPCRPFCSERCRMVDLGNWAAERYRIADAAAPPGGPADDDDGPTADD